jgi:NTE family protein
MRLVAALAVPLLASLAAMAADCVEEPAKIDVPAFAISPGRTVGLALGSGSFHALAHVGAIEALEDAGVKVSVVSGTSAGALVGSLWASGMPAHEIEKRALESDWDDIGSWRFFGGGLMSNAKLRKELEGIFGDRAIETWPKRFVAVATNVDNGHPRLLMAGSGALAVQASTAMPAIFAPVTIDGEKLADGALVEPVPVQAARVLGANYVIAVDVAYRPYEGKVSGITGYAFQGMHILVNTLAERQLRDADLVIRLDVHHLMGCGGAAMVAAGRNAMTRALPDLAKELSR